MIESVVRFFTSKNISATPPVVSTVFTFIEIEAYSNKIRKQRAILCSSLDLEFKRTALSISDFIKGMFHVISFHNIKNTVYHHYKFYFRISFFVPFLNIFFVLYKFYNCTFINLVVKYPFFSTSYLC